MVDSTPGKKLAFLGRRAGKCGLDFARGCDQQVVNVSALHCVIVAEV